MKNQLKNKLLSKTEYLAAASGDAQKAFELMAADAYALQSEAQDFEAEGSIRAREITRALSPLAEKLGIPLPAAGSKPSAEAITAMTEAVARAAAPKDETPDWSSALTRLGFTAEQIAAANTPEARAALLATVHTEVVTLRQAAQDANLYRYAAISGYSAEALKRIRGSETLTEREVEGEDGTKEKVWGVLEGDTFTPAAEAFAPVLGAAKTAEKPAEKRATPWVTQTGQAKQTSNPLVASKEAAADKKTYSL